MPVDLEGLGNYLFAVSASLKSIYMTDEYPVPCRRVFSGQCPGAGHVG